jgi:hypothetical protein
MPQFTIKPILGRKTNVPANDPSLFKYIADNIALTHDVGGLNFDLTRTRNCCTKSLGETKWSSAATTGTTRCQGIFELYNGSQRDRLIVYDGKVYYYDSARAPQDISGSVTFANADTDLFSFIRVGNYAVWADRGTTTPYKWQNADASASKLIASGTEYIFRYLVSFQRRVIGLYSDQTDGDIEIRWSTDWPTTAITDLNFPAGNQLYVPNDDVIVGAATMGRDRCYIYCENSIQQLIYYPDYTQPFRCYTVVPSHGGVNQQSIITVQGRHYFFCPDYGFCEYQGGDTIAPISDDIEADVQAIDTDYYNLINGDFLPLSKHLVWAVPANGSANPNQLWFYDLNTKQWTIEDKNIKVIKSMRMYDAYTWNDLISDLSTAGYGNTPTWNDLLTWKGNTVRWGDLVDFLSRLCFSNNDGHLYYMSGDSLSSGNLDGYRIEPIIALAGRKRSKINRIWFQFNDVGNFDIDVYHRSGSTVGEIENKSWTLIGTVSANSPEQPFLDYSVKDYLHQIKWGTDLNNEKFGVTDIRFDFEIGEEF